MSKEKVKTGSNPFERAARALFFRPDFGWQHIFREDDLYWIGKGESIKGPYCEIISVLRQDGIAKEKLDGRMLFSDCSSSLQDFFRTGLESVREHIGKREYVLCASSEIINSCKTDGGLKNGSTASFNMERVSVGRNTFVGVRSFDIFPEATSDRVLVCLQERLEPPEIKAMFYLMDRDAYKNGELEAYVLAQKASLREVRVLMKTKGVKVVVGELSD